MNKLMNYSVIVSVTQAEEYHKSIVVNNGYHDVFWRHFNKLNLIMV